MSKRRGETFAHLLSKYRKTTWFFACLFWAGTLLAGWLFWWNDSVSIDRPFPSTVIADQHGNAIGEMLSVDGSRHVPLAYSEFSPILVDGLITLEDREFRDHMGISVTGLVRSAWNNIRVRFGYATGIQWGSTLTMGLARNILGINRSRGLREKIQEAALALRIEAKYSKEDILAGYLNRVHFGRLAVGIGAAAQRYFGKPLGQLTPAEHIALLTLIRNPGQYDPVTEPETFRKRYLTVVSTMEENGVLTPESAMLVREEPLVWTNPKWSLPYVSDLLRTVAKDREYAGLPPAERTAIEKRFETGGMLVTSIDLGMTDRISAIADSVRTGLQSRNVSDYAILVVDRSTMKIRVLIGGANYYGNSGQVNAIFAPRQVGSTMKPFTYLLGITERWHRMSDTILDAPASYLTADGNPYEPKNYTLGYRGTVTLAEALAGSINVPAVKIAQEVGVKTLLQFVRSLGVTSLRESPDHYGLALTLGVGEISLWELLRAYTIFADGWKLHEFSILAETPSADGKPLADPGAVSQIVASLSSHQLKSAEFPTGSALDFGEGHVFVKTGTSRNFRDNYAVGFTERYLIGVWTGNKDGSNMRGVSGASGAGEIFSGIVNELGEWDGKITPDGAVVPIPVNSSTFPDDTITISTPLDGTRYRKDDNVPADRQDVTVKYWSKTPFENVAITLISSASPSATVNLSNGKVPVGKLERGSYRIRVEGFRKESVLVAESAFEIE